MPRRQRRFRKTPQPKPKPLEPSFVLQYAESEIHETAYKHGVSTLDIHHACAQSIAKFKIDNESVEAKILIVGPDSAGNLLEVIGLEIDNKPLLIIHAMKLRKSVIRLLEGPS